MLRLERVNLETLSFLNEARRLKKIDGEFGWGGTSVTR